MNNIKLLILGVFVFIVAQTITWYQINSQFIWDWAKRNQLIIAVLGIPISYLFQYGTKLIVESFQGTMWPARFMSFGSGIIIYAILVSIYFQEGVSLKTAISIALAVSILLIQIFW
jgi:hypothetical protein